MEKESSEEQEEENSSGEEAEDLLLTSSMMTVRGGQAGGVAKEVPISKTLNPHPPPRIPSCAPMPHQESLSLAPVSELLGRAAAPR